MIAVAVATLAFLWPPRPPGLLQRSILRPVMGPSGIRIEAPGYTFIGDIAVFDDELFAFLMFDYYRSLKTLQGREIFVTSIENPEGPSYRISIRLPESLEAGVEELSELKLTRLVKESTWRWVDPAELARTRRHTALFLSTWTAPGHEDTARIDSHRLQAYLRRFIRFKSLTDGRIRKQLPPIPAPLSKDAASRLAADIIAVSDFFRLPLEMLLGIGAMENNYMNVAGDVANTAWKRRAEPGDVVLKRRGGKVLIRNDSQGVWQITRQSLRDAHRLYLADTRDYTALPERLRPPRKLDIDNVSPDCLTTYAGLLLRSLIDHFGGDVTKAAGAYNGGVSRPNEHYAAGVERVAGYARAILQSAAARDAANVNRRLGNRLR